ncbi:MAG: sulfite exporter TauE/SafE family protein [Proteobacteria bacterium]|nr:sulfite exporter TauE/SafE family protein [Pseudomonadota bacterium]
MLLDAVTWPLVLELLALGSVVGVLAGLLGIGGGMIMVPFLTLMLEHRGVPTAMAMKMAIATAMATITVTSLSSLRAHHARGAVRWPVVAGMAPGVVLGGLVAGAGVFALLKGKVLGFVFAGFLLFSALQMALDRKPKPSRSTPGPLGLASAGGVIGLVSGLVGAGGGFLTVPFLVWRNVPVHQAVGTSAALGFPIALAATAGYVIGGWRLPPALPGAFGYLYLPALVLIMATSMWTAPLGVRLAHALNVAQLKRGFAVVLVGLAVTMFYKALHA